LLFVRFWGQADINKRLPNNPIYEHAPLAPAFCTFERLPNGEMGERQRVRFDAERRQRIVDRIGDAGRSFLSVASGEGVHLFAEARRHASINA
jgi:hypothetical protein